MAFKDSIKRLIASKSILEKGMFRLYQWQNGEKVRNEIDRRRKLSIFDIEQLSAEISFGPDERVIDNNLYGYAQHLKKFAGIDRDLYAYMEHGLFLGNVIHLDQYHWHFKGMITMTSNRRELLQKEFPEKTILDIGPYIHYAQALGGESLYYELKKKLGKTLLVFPFHSMKSVKADYDRDQFIQEIKRVGKQYDSVLICLYYLDALDNDTSAAYRAEGFHLTTAGHRFDRHFVARLRLQIELADMTLSNGMGTQTGFCTFLGKPHYIYQQQVGQKANSTREQVRFASSTGLKGRELANAQRHFFSQLFNELRDDISPEQQKATADFWGFDSIKTPSEIKSFVQQMHS
jgi:hypothetical protein